ncbi:MAG: hypothetical protein HYV37_00020 [Candidatus Levyibacteriota bacterium]|nr:MAG: hypothetical protein HYV37_00020 [Candidatus Levybacteria bacterium]
MQDISSKIKHYFYRLHFFLNKNPNIKHFFGILAFILILPLTIGAVLTVQNLRQQASGNDNLQILDAPNGSPISQTSNTDVYLQIKLPADWVLPTPQSRNKDGFIKKAYASHILYPLTSARFYLSLLS